MKRFFRVLALYLFHIGFVRPVLYFVGGARYRRKNVAPRGPCIVVANHNSHLDAAILMTLFPLSRLPHVHPVAAADYFGKNAFLRMMAMMLMNGIPIERRAARGEDPLRGVVTRLEQGDTLIFFPEGSRGEAGVLAQFRPGIGKLVKNLPGLLVVPVFMSGPERIWPRGQLIPVPVNIHANVGRPRTYSTDLGSRQIADMVRSDVLALAPPPPAIPGSRQGPPVRVGICSVDPDLRRDVFRHVTEKLGRFGRTIGLSDRVVEADGEGVSEPQGGIPITHSLGLPRVLAWLFRTGGMFKGGQFATMVDRARLDEALEHHRSARFVVSDGCPIADLLAWSRPAPEEEPLDAKRFQRLLSYLSGRRRIPASKWWTYATGEPEIWLLNVLDLARPPVPEVLALLRLPPDDAMTRMRSRGEPLERLRNESAVAGLQASYDVAATTLRRKGETTVLPVDAGGRAPEEIADEIVAACIEGRAPEGREVVVADGDRNA